MADACYQMAGDAKGVAQGDNSSQKRICSPHIFRHRVVTRLDTPQFREPHHTITAKLAAKPTENKNYGRNQG